MFKKRSLNNKGVSSVVGSLMMITIVVTFFSILTLYQNTEMNKMRELIRFMNDINFEVTEIPINEDVTPTGFDPNIKNNNLPQIMCAYPYDKWGIQKPIEFMPNCTIHLYDIDPFDEHNITFYYRLPNVSGIDRWQFGAFLHLPIGETVATWQYAFAIDPKETYQWMVDIDDGHSSISEIYAFKTRGL